MNTFLPLPDIQASVKTLDSKRLGKMRLESFQLLTSIFGYNKGGYATRGWFYHPASRAWWEHEEALKLYCNACIDEWKARGYNNNMRYWKVFHEILTYPWWFGLDKFHASHRAALLAKDYGWYSQFGWVETPTMNYFWPMGAGNVTVVHPDGKVTRGPYSDPGPSQDLSRHQVLGYTEIGTGRKVY